MARRGLHVQTTILDPTAARLPPEPTAPGSTVDL
jgi:hypothetical protein